MPDRPEPGPSAFDDPTRDIKFSRPPAWSPARPAADPLPGGPDLSAPPPAQPSSAGAVPPLPSAGPTEPPLGELPTDQLAHGSPRLRERTLAFSHPEMSRRPVGPVKVGPARRWPWVVLVLLPMLVIAGAGIALLLILRGA